MPSEPGAGAPLSVIKLGGEVVAGPTLAAIAGDVAALARDGQRVVMVHGGGPQATKLQERLGQKPVIVAGRRVTDPETLEVMKMVVAGQLNVDLCAALIAGGARPIGLSGPSGLVIEAERRPPRVYAGAGAAPIDLGLVGDVKRIDRALLEMLLGAGLVPVLACLGADRRGQVYNINADIVANRVAAELGADGLYLVSDVAGVLRDVNDPASRIARLTVAEGKGLIASGAVTRGMIPKLEESFAALGTGVARIHIIGKLRAGDLAREAAAPGSVGTVLVP
jgi:acetylglutamate kinase